MREIFGLRLLAFAFLLVTFTFLAACVPSPTATPPLRSPFPTLPRFDGTVTPEPGATEVLGTPPAATLIPTFTPPTPVPLPTNGALTVDTLPPVAQLTVQDPEIPVSFEQAVPLNVLAADNNIVARLELYDNNVLLASAPVVLPASVYSNQFTWEANELGRHVLRAIAYDAQGNASAPAEVILNVINNNRSPGIQIVSPSGNKDVELGAPVLIQGVGTDDAAVTRIDLIVDNQLVTFAVPERPGGVTPFAVALPWTPTTTGSHAIVLRAYDNRGESDDSLPYSIRAFDNQPPVVIAQSEYDALAPGEVLVVQALALSNNGLNRVELYVDERLRDAVNSTLPARQTALEASLSAPDLAEGSHTFFVRAFDFTGHRTDSPRASIQVHAGVPRVNRATRTPPAAGTALPPTRTVTPAIVLPGPPTIELQLGNPPVILPNTAQVRILARGSSELDRIELWGRAPGETSAQLLLEENVQGATEKTLTYEWQAPRAGVVEMFARVSDNLNQARLSLPLRFDVRAPTAPSPVPVTFDFSRAWSAESPGARFEVTFRQIGRALRGTLVEQLADGQILNGTLVSGGVSEKNVVFGVELTAGGSPGTALPGRMTLEFDCFFNQRPPTLTCNYTTEKGERGSAVFEPVGP